MTSAPSNTIAADTPYRGRQAVLATKHGKEEAVSPAFSGLLGISLVVPRSLDTDQLGTFTGEVPRPGTMRETLRQKAWMGVKATGVPLSIASEGSFGPHPMLPFLPSAREMLMFLDAERGIEVVEERLSERTNFAVLEVSSEAKVAQFLDQVRFPSHALIFRDGDRIVKGITSRRELEELMASAKPGARLETDMRAHLNPTRMEEIGKLAKRLARRVATPCPACGMPGFGVTGTERGLVCAKCGSETPLVKFLVKSCSTCGHAERCPRTDGRMTANPAECQECNP